MKSGYLQISIFEFKDVELSCMGSSERMKLIRGYLERQNQMGENVDMQTLAEKLVENHIIADARPLNCYGVIKSLITNWYIRQKEMGKEKFREQKVSEYDEQ